MSVSIIESRCERRGGGFFLVFRGRNPHKRPRPKSPKRDTFLPHFACRFRRKKIGKPTHRKSITAEMAEEESTVSNLRRAWKYDTMARLTSLRLSNDIQPPARDATGLDGSVPRALNRHASQQEEQKRRDADDGEEGDEDIRVSVELAVRGRHEPEDEEANGDADEEGAHRVEDLDDRGQEDDGPDLRRRDVFDVAADAVFDLEDCEDALGDGEGLGRNGVSGETCLPF